MVKIVIYITKFIIVAITALLFASCNFSGNFKSITGSGNVTTEKRVVSGNFKNVESSNALDVFIEQGDKYEVIVEADDNLQKSIITKVENGTLIIECDFNSFHNISSKKVTVKMPVIEQLEANSASSIKSLNTLKGTNIKLHTSSAASINVNLESDMISLDSSSGSNIIASGKALQVEAEASSGSSIETSNLFANDINADVSSGATITIHPIVNLKAEASSGGNINYNTTPKTIERKSSSGGSINKI